MQNPEVLARIKEREEELAVAAELDAAWVLKQWRDIAIADPNELSKVVTVPCSLCWLDADGFPRERVETYRLLGFDPRVHPCPECQQCDGDGEERIKLADTTKLRGPARRLFAGAKMGKNGIEIKMRDQDAALANISRYLGMVVERKEVSGPGGGPVSLATVNLNDLTDEQIMALIADENTPQNAIEGGTIEGTLQLADSNPLPLNELEDVSSP